MTTSTELADRIQQVTRRLRRAAVGALAPLGLTPAQERALLIVARAQQPLRMGELAAKMQVVPRSVTSLIDALEQAGLVARTTDPDNRRSILLALTEAGTAAQAEVAAARAAAASEVFGVLSAEQRTQLGDLLALLTTPEHHHH